MSEHGSDDTTTALERLPHATLAALGREAAAAPAERPEVAIVAAANTARFVFRPGNAGA